MLVALVGATGTGKSELSLDLAEELTRDAVARPRSSTPTRCSSIAAWTSARPSCPSTSAAASRTTCSTCSTRSTRRASPATRLEARAIVERHRRTRRRPDPGRGQRALRVERRLRLPVPGNRPGHPRAARGASSTTTGRAPCTAGCGRSTRRRPRRSGRTTAAGWCAPSRSSSSPADRSAPACRRSRPCGDRR